MTIGEGSKVFSAFTFSRDGREFVGMKIRANSWSEAQNFLDEECLPFEIYGEYVGEVSWEHADKATLLLNPNEN